MKKTLQIVSAVLSLCLCAALLTACGSTYTAADLVKDTLDLYYLDSPTEAHLEQTDMTEEEAHEEYERWLGLEVPFFCQEFGIELDSCEPQIETQIQDLYRRIYTHSRYEVKGMDKDDNTYQIEVTVYPIDILQKVYTDYMDAFSDEFGQRIASGSLDGITEEEYETLWAQGVIDLVSDHLEELDYLEPKTIKIRLEKDEDGLYGINLDDFQKADELILAY